MEHLHCFPHPSIQDEWWFIEWWKARWCNGWLPEWSLPVSVWTFLLVFACPMLYDMITSTSKVCILVLLVVKKNFQSAAIFLLLVHGWISIQSTGGVFLTGSFFLFMTHACIFTKNSEGVNGHWRNNIHLSQASTTSMYRMCSRFVCEMRTRWHTRTFASFFLTSLFSAPRTYSTC